MKKIKFVLTCLLPAVSVASFAQNVQVKGKVVDANTGEGVPFASVQLKGTMTGTSTDADGSYFLTVPSRSSLIFSSIGYQTQEVAVEGRTVIDIILAPDAEFLEAQFSVYDSGDRLTVTMLAQCREEQIIRSFEAIRGTKKAIMHIYNSTSTLQRRLKVGYARAGRLTDEMEERGIISAKDGSKPRTCLITREEWEAMRASAL